MVINLNILFENTTQYTKEVYSEFLKFHNEKYNFSYTFYTLFFAMLMLFCIIVHIKNLNIYYAILFIVVFICFILWRFFRPVFRVKKEVKSEKISKEKKFKFVFYKNYFKIYDKKDVYKLYYFNLHKVFETNKFFYLYIDKEHSFLLNKDGFSVGSASEFSEFIKKKCWFKYKNVKKQV